MNGAAPPAEDVTALILAAGEGDRLGRPKALLSAGGMTLLEHAVALVAPLADEVIVGVRAADMTRAGVLLGDRAVPVAGGGTRRQTLLNVLAAATRPLILLHEVARPLATPELCARVLAAALEFDAACPCVAASRRDSIAIVDGDFFGQGLARDRVVRTQTPQAYRRELLADAMLQAEQNGWEDSSAPPACVRAGYRVRMIPGERDNLKITFGEDWDFVRDRIAG